MAMANSGSGGRGKKASPAAKICTQFGSNANMITNKEILPENIFIPGKGDTDDPNGAHEPDLDSYPFSLDDLKAEGIEGTLYYEYKCVRIGKLTVTTSLEPVNESN